MARRKTNPWAVCNAQADREGGWTKRKMESCVRKVKKGRKR